MDGSTIWQDPSSIFFRPPEVHLAEETEEKGEISQKQGWFVVAVGASAIALVILFMAGSVSQLLGAKLDVANWLLKAFDAVNGTAGHYALYIIGFGGVIAGGSVIGFGAHLIITDKKKEPDAPPDNTPHHRMINLFYLFHTWLNSQLLPHLNFSR